MEKKNVYALLKSVLLTYTKLYCIVEEKKYEFNFISIVGTKCRQDILILLSNDPLLFRKHKLVTVRGQGKIYLINITFSYFKKDVSCDFYIDGNFRVKVDDNFSKLTKYSIKNLRDVFEELNLLSISKV